MTVTRLVLVRHGHSQATANKVVGGPKGDTGLTELGRRQVQALADRWRRSEEVADAGALYASTLPRAIETAEILAAVLPWLELVTDCELCEIHPGECDGLPWDEWSERYGPGSPDVPLSPGGESFDVFNERIAARLPRFLDDHPGETVVVATHGGFVIGSVFALLGVDHRSEQRAYLDPSNSAVTEWLYDEGRWELARYNDCAHLLGVV